MGRAGIVLGLEVSRLARNSMDWHRLLEICALTDTLILDEDGIYDPAHFNDRLLLGLKGTMSEAELHVLRARLRGGILNKARRGELMISPPVGLVYNSAGELILDPDQQVQQSMRFLFETFRRTGSASATVKDFRQQGLLFPRRLRSGPHRGELVWTQLGHNHTLRILHNPRYAGAFAFGRSRTRKGVDGSETITWLPRDQWDTLIPGAHAGYIGWEEYEANQRRLRESAQAQGQDRRNSPPREGPALLQGLIVCGICGNRMTVRYHVYRRKLCPQYVCQMYGIEHGEPICQAVPGVGIDQAISALLVEAMTPMALEVALCVQQELQCRLEEVDQLRRQRVERARYEADLAQRRYMHVDPANRLVVDSLEADWNNKLRALAEAQQDYESQRQTDAEQVNEEERRRILALATDFPGLWSDPKIPDRERKRMIRLLVEDVTLLRGDQITLHVRFKGGACRTLTLPLPLNAWQRRLTRPEVVTEIDRLLDHHTNLQIATILNERGYRSGEGQRFKPHLVARLRCKYGLKSRYDRLRQAGLLTLRETARLLGITPQWVKAWRRHGLLAAQAYNDRGECLYQPLGQNPPCKMQGRKLSARQRFLEVVSNRTDEVQCEA
jgi:DNA invertase Pin-like site-specific DNA recombinase